MSPQHLKALIVEDEDGIAELIKVNLEDMGLECQLAKDGVDGLELFASALESSSPYDLVVTDLGLPRMSGIQLVKEMRKLEAQSCLSPCFIFVASGMLSKNKVVELMKSGCSSYIFKPFRGEDLVKKLKETFPQLQD